MWHRNFIPTVFLWVGAQPSFWSIEIEHLLPALQAIFDVAYPGMMHNVQPKGPIVGLVNQCLCSWRSNFGSTAIVLVTNFMASHRDSESGDDDNAEFKQALAEALLSQYAFLYENSDTCNPDEIYRSTFMLEMIETAHVNATTGFLEVPALNTRDLQLNGMQAIIAACAITVGPGSADSDFN
ncbi:hypothetical protein DFH29DRAFT_809189 [Suillus ampliporus]|nr:hypothetical protein DFH29DRAFT_809189 [Suillus ampliporus]